MVREVLRPRCVEDLMLARLDEIGMLVHVEKDSKVSFNPASCYILPIYWEVDRK